MSQRGTGKVLVQQTLTIPDELRGRDWVEEVKSSAIASEVGKRPRWLATRRASERLVTGQSGGELASQGHNNDDRELQAPTWKEL
jgi:hypothetical protein